MAKNQYALKGLLHVVGRCDTASDVFIHRIMNPGICDGIWFQAFVKHGGFTFTQPRDGVYLNHRVVQRCATRQGISRFNTFIGLLKWFKAFDVSTTNK